MKIAHRPILRNYILHMVTICRVGYSAVDVMIWTFENFFCCEKLCVADTKACSLITRSQLTKYCVMPTVVSDQSGMSDILKSSNHYIDASTAERPTRVDNQERRPGSPSHIFSSSSCSIHQKGCRWYKGPQPYYALPNS